MSEQIFWNTSFNLFERKLAEMPGKPQSAFFEGFQSLKFRPVYCILNTVYCISVAKTSIGRGMPSIAQTFYFCQRIGSTPLS